MGPGFMQGGSHGFPGQEKRKKVLYCSWKTVIAIGIQYCSLSVTVLHDLLEEKGHYRFFFYEY